MLSCELAFVHACIIVCLWKRVECLQWTLTVDMALYSCLIVKIESEWISFEWEKNPSWDTSRFFDI